MHFYNNNAVYQSNSKYNNDQAGYFRLIFMMFEFYLGGVIFKIHKDFCTSPLYRKVIYFYDKYS